LRLVNEFWLAVLLSSLYRRAKFSGARRIPDYKKICIFSDVPMPRTTSILYCINGAVT